LDLHERKISWEENIEMIKRRNNISVSNEYCGLHTEVQDEKWIIDVLQTQYRLIFYRWLWLK
jgi:hypothetical protein